jgi:hypothetical protein
VAHSEICQEVALEAQAGQVRESLPARRHLEHLLQRLLVWRLRGAVDANRETRFHRAGSRQERVAPLTLSTCSLGQILLVLFVNILLYVAFSAFLFLVARILPMPRRLQSSHLQHPLLLSTAKDGVVQERVESGWWEEKKLMDGPTTVALLFCGAAKGQSILGSSPDVLVD